MANHSISFKGKDSIHCSIQKITVVRYGNDDSVKAIQIIFQNSKCLDIQIVGRLIKEQEQKTEKVESKSKETWKQREKKLKFTYKEQRELETIDEDIAKLESKLEKLDQDIMKNATNSVKLSELMKEKEEAEQALEDKMDRWVYLNDLNEKIQGGVS